MGRFSRLLWTFFPYRMPSAVLLPLLGAVRRLSFLREKNYSPYTASSGVPDTFFLLFSKAFQSGPFPHAKPDWGPLQKSWEGAGGGPEEGKPFSRKVSSPSPDSSSTSPKRFA